SIKNAIVGQCAVEGMVLDYERGLWKAAKEVFPVIKLRGCAFHWGQAIWRTVQRLGLATQYSQDRGTHAFIRKVLSLPFLHQEHIRPTFECMKDYTSSEAVLPLLEYLDQQWFNSPCWTVEEWCVFGQAVRTNNDVEGWHRPLNRKTGAAPPSFVLLQILHRKAKDVEEQIHLSPEDSEKIDSVNAVKAVQCIGRLHGKGHNHFRATEEGICDIWTPSAQNR
ncbi:hypothetical protein MAR_033797, partial [Mya arenaria]